MSRVPRCVIGLILLVPVWALQHLDIAALVSYGLESAVTDWAAPLAFFFVLFTPGAMRRGNWRHVLLMLGIAAAVYAADASFASWCPLPFPYWWVLQIGLPVMAVGVAEWALVRPRSTTSPALLFVLALSLALAFLIPVLVQMLDLAPRAVIRIGSVRSYTNWGSLVRWPLIVALTWIAIPAASSLVDQPIRRGRAIAAGAVLGSGALFLLFFHVLMYAFARQSLDGGGPFTRDSAVAVLQIRADAADLQALWLTADASDWTAPEDDFSDYRRTLINVLIGLDRGAAAPRLSRMIRENPSPLLAEVSAELLAAEREYEAVPVLTRYAFQGVEPCTKALESLKVPHVALRIIAEASAYYRPTPGTDDFPIPPEKRQRLTRLLDRDAGPNLSDWTNYYDAKTQELPTTLPPDVAAETLRVIQATLSYWDAVNRLHDARRQVIAQRTRTNGEGELIEKLRTFHTTNRHRRPTDAEIMSAISPAGLSKVEKYNSVAALDMTVTPPDWNVRGTDALEKEVADYAKRVDTTVDKHLLPATRPTTAPDN